MVPAADSQAVGIVPQLSVRRGLEAVAFYQAALGAVEVYRVGGTEENRAVVAQLTVGDASFWVADESPAHENFSPESVGGGTVRMLLIVDDPEAAVVAGCDVDEPAGHPDVPDQLRAEQAEVERAVACIAT